MFYSYNIRLQTRYKPVPLLYFPMAARHWAVYVRPGYVPDPLHVMNGASYSNSRSSWDHCHIHAVRFRVLVLLQSLCISSHTNRSKDRVSP